jgi:hypothetical protein
VDLQPESDIFGNRQRERIRPLKDHSHSPAQSDQVRLWINDIYPVYVHLPGYAHAFDQIIHPVQNAQQRGFPAAGRADHSGYPVCLECGADIDQCLKILIPQIQGFNGYFMLPSVIIQIYL